MSNETFPLWQATTSVESHPPLDRDAEADVVIIGAGITGLTAAVVLAERGKKIIVLEQNRVAAGETGHTTAHITEAVDARYHFIAQSYNRETAKLVAEASRAAIDQIADNVTSLGIECSFKRLPGYLYTESRNKVAELKSEAASAKEAGVAARWTEEVPLPFATRGAVIFEDQARFHPGRYMRGLADHLKRMGVAIHEGTHVTEIEKGEPCIVHTANGTVRAAAVFQATNIPIEGFNTLNIKASQYRTYAAAYGIETPFTDGLYWDTYDPYHYTRFQETDAGMVIIVGGEDHEVGQEKDTEQSYKALDKYVHEKFGDLPQWFRWSGQVVEPADGLPFIGGGPVYVSTGYAGQGMTFGTFGGMLVADLITGRKNRWSELFHPMRLHLRGAVKDLVTENVHFPLHLVLDRLTKADVETDDTLDVRSGEGKIVDVKGRKLAVYRDETGTLCALSPVCTHMKCDVAWNTAERSWDCPCHGSRFGIDGKVLNGPAIEPLAKVEIDEKDDTRLG